MHLEEPFMFKHSKESLLVSARPGGAAGIPAMRAFFFLLTLSSLASAGPPEIVRVRIPASKVAGWSPGGTEPRMMGDEPFDRLLEAARRGVAAPVMSRQGRLIRARHHARWKK